jgi:hypothetical protein
VLKASAFIGPVPLLCGVLVRPVAAGSCMPVRGWGFVVGDFFEAMHGPPLLGGACLLGFSLKVWRFLGLFVGLGVVVWP